MESCMKSMGMKRSVIKKMEAVLFMITQMQVNGA